MRTALALMSFCAASLIGAGASAQDRYGDDGGQRATPASDRSDTRPATPYRGPYLSWASKGGAAHPLPAPAPAPSPGVLPTSLYAAPAQPTPYRRPEPQAPAATPPPSRPWEHLRAVPTTPAPAPVQTAPEPVASAEPSRPWARLGAAPSTPQPAPVPTATQPVAVAALPPPSRRWEHLGAVSAPRPAPAAPQTVQAQAAQPQQMAQNTAPPQPAPSAPVRTRYYSLHREYGDTPDRIVIPTERPMVLIGPADPPPASHDDPDSDTPHDGASGHHAAADH